MGRPLRSIIAVGGGGSLVGSGCAERGVASGPASPPGVGTWVLVWMVVGLVVAVLTMLIGGRGRGRWSPAVAVLAIQAAAVLVGGTVLAWLAIATWPLADAKAAGTLQMSESLLRISVTDGDPRFFTLMLLTVAVLGTLLFVLLAMTARFARTNDPIERAVASAVLVLELAPAIYGLLRLLQGHPTALAFIAAGHLPILVLAITSAWPRRSRPALEPTGEDRDEPLPATTR